MCSEKFKTIIPQSKSRSFKLSAVQQLHYIINVRYVSGRGSSWDTVQTKKEIPFNSELNVLQVKSMIKDSKTRIEFYTPNVQRTWLTLPIEKAGTVYVTCFGSDVRLLQWKYQLPISTGWFKTRLQILNQPQN